MRISKNSLCLGAALCALLSFNSAHADELKLSNGDTLSGQTVDVTRGEGLHFKMAYGQKLLVPWAEVDSLTDENGAPIEIKPEVRSGENVYLVESAEPKSVVPAPNEPTLDAMKQELVIVDSAAIKPAPAETETTQAAAPKDTWLGGVWSGRINFGTSLQDGNTDKKNLTIDGETKGKWDDIHRLTLGGEYNYEDDNGIVTEDEQKLKAAYDYFMSEKWFTNMHANFEKDDPANLDLRSEYGIGLGYQPYESDDLNLQMVLGPSYIKEEFSTGANDESANVGWSLDYDQRIWEQALQIYHKHGLDVPADDTENFIFESESGVRVPIKAGIIASGAIDFDWDNDPPAGTTEQDTEYSVKLGYEW